MDIYSCETVGIRQRQGCQWANGWDSLYSEFSTMHRTLLPEIRRERTARPDWNYHLAWTFQLTISLPYRTGHLLLY